MCTVSDFFINDPPPTAKRAASSSHSRPAFLRHNQPLTNGYKQALAHDFGARGAQAEEIVTMDDSGLRNLNLQRQGGRQRATIEAVADSRNSPQQAANNPASPFEVS